MDRLDALQTFVTVVDSGSFTRAAEVLRLPKATVTKRLQALEGLLGVRLMQRTTRRLTLTDDGMALYERAQRLVGDWQELASGMQQAAAQPAGRLRVDVPAAAGRHVIGPALPRFLAAYPALTVEIGVSDRPVDLLAEGVDCVIRGGEVFDESLVGRPLGAFEVVTCAAPAYLQRHGMPAHPGALDAGHAVVAFFSPKSGRMFPFDFARDGHALAVNGARRVAANDADTYLALGLAGLGVMQLPRTRVVAAHLDAGALVPVLADWSAGSLPLQVLYPRNRHLSPRVRVFVDWVLALYADEFAALAGRGRGGGRPPVSAA